MHCFSKSLACRFGLKLPDQTSAYCAITVLGDLELDKFKLFEGIYCNLLEQQSNILPPIVSFANLLEHIEKHEPKELAKITKNSFVYTSKNVSNISSWKIVGLRKFSISSKEIFLLNGSISDKVMKIWISFFGNKKEAKRYEFSMSLRTGSTQEIRYRGPVHSLDLNSEEILSSGCFFALPVSFSERILKQTGRWFIDVKIHLLNEKEAIKVPF